MQFKNLFSTLVHPVEIRSPGNTIKGPSSDDAIKQRFRGKPS